MDLVFKPNGKEVVPSPDHLMIVGPPKVGKSTILSMLPEHGIFNIEPGGTDGYKYLPHAVHMTPKNMADFKTLAAKAYQFSRENEGKKPYKYCVVDNMDVFEQWCEDQATADYMADAKGAKFNRWSAAELRSNGLGTKFKPGDLKPKKHQQSVLTLANGAGYLWHREAFKKAIVMFSYLAEKVIYICHPRDKTLNKDGQDVSIRVVNLTGQLGPILAGMCDACCFLRRQGNKVLADFSPDDFIAGCRIPTLEGKEIVLSEKDKETGNITVNWHTIYPEIETPAVLEL